MKREEEMSISTKPVEVSIQHLSNSRTLLSFFTYRVWIEYKK